MSNNERYRSFFDAVSYDFFVRIYDPVRRRITVGAEAFDDSNLFIHIPKNAGISLFSALGARNVGHRLFCDIPEAERDAAARIVFCTRDPYDRLVSAYRYQQRLLRTKSAFQRASLLGDLGSFESFVMSRKFDRLAAHHFFFRSQFRYLQGIERYAQKLVHLRFENLAADVKAKLGIDVERLNSSSEADSLPATDDRLRDRVRSVYRDDYDALPQLLRDCGLESPWAG